MHLISADHDLNLFRECERCFWLHYKSPVPRFYHEPSFFETASRSKLHEHYDKFRNSLPPEMSGRMDGILLDDTQLIGHWRDAQRGLRHSDSVLSAVLCGTMDDCLINDNEYYVPIEFQMAFRELEDDELKARQSFLDSLIYLLTTNGYKTLEFGYVVCYFPESVSHQAALTLRSKVLRLDTDMMRAERVFYEASDLLRQKSIPESGGGCPYCIWLKARSTVERKK